MNEEDIYDVKRKILSYNKGSILGAKRACLNTIMHLAFLDINKRGLNLFNRQKLDFVFNNLKILKGKNISLERLFNNFYNAIIFWVNDADDRLILFQYFRATDLLYQLTEPK